MTHTMSLLVVIEPFKDIVHRLSPYPTSRPQGHILLQVQP
jgi:hypothetical protein